VSIVFLALLTQGKIMVTTIAYGLAIVLSLFIIVLGVRFLVVPRAAAVGYAVPPRKVETPPT
jgi:hypothetical protein